MEVEETLKQYLLRAIEIHTGYKAEFGESGKKGLIPAPNGYDGKADIRLGMWISQLHEDLGMPEIILKEPTTKG